MQGVRTAKSLNKLPRNVCPLCAALKDFRSDYISALGARTTQALCKIHVLMVANAGEAGAVADLFLACLTIRSKLTLKG